MPEQIILLSNKQNIEENMQVMAVEQKFRKKVVESFKRFQWGQCDESLIKPKILSKCLKVSACRFQPE